MKGRSTAQQIITALQLAPLPGEGGYFRQTWRSEAGSAIVFLLTPECFSALHRLDRPELWHFYSGDPVELVQLGRDGEVRVTLLGPAVMRGEVPQALVPADSWQGARIAAATAAAGYSLLGCTLAPPWDERGFELGERDSLRRQFPAAAAWIQALTR